MRQEVFVYLQACQATSVRSVSLKTRPVVWRNTASFPQSLPECGNCSGLRQRRRKASIFEEKPVATLSKHASCSK